MGADAAHPNPEVAKRLQHIYTLHRTDIDLRLGGSPYDFLLERLGNPHRKMPPVVHVAGTNGKGSVIAFMRAMLEAAGYKVHVYTSPHLVTFNERIRIAGKLIDDEHLISLYDRVAAANTGTPITFFEFTTTMAFLAFAETPADIALLETGMGGRLDCTNLVANPLATIITKISFDHTEFLGTTLAAIAGEKAGIMKAGALCVIGPQMDASAVMPIFENAAKKLGIDLCVIGKNTAESLPSDYPTPNLVGAHQIENAATALAAIDILNTKGFAVSDSAKKQGISHADWPGRMQRITDGPIAALLPSGWELWFDAAHNDSGAMALAAQLGKWKAAEPATPIHLVTGLAADKDVEAFFHALSGTYDSVTLIDLPNARKPSKAAETRAKIGQLTLTDCYEKKCIREAILAIIKAKPNPKNKLIICGSMYLYGEIYAINE